jgi:hypothetical protein
MPTLLILYLHIQPTLLDSETWFSKSEIMVPERIHFHSTPLIWPLIGQKILGCASREYKDITMTK